MRSAAVLLMLSAACGREPVPPSPAPSPPASSGSVPPSVAVSSASGAVPIGSALAPPAAPKPPLVLDEVLLFPPHVATPGPQIAPLLEALAAKLRDYPDARIEIAGHCNDEEVVEVAFARANLVASGLAARGVPRTRVRVESYGNLRPVVPNTNEENRAKNRRVDFRIVKEGAE